MTTFFLAPVEPDKWSKKKSDLLIDFKWFRERLQDEWPLARIRIPGETKNILLWWQLPPEKDGNALTGGLQANKQIVSFETGPRRSFIKFVLWYRDFVSDTYQLFLFNDSQEAVLEITDDTLEKDIERFVKFT